MIATGRLEEDNVSCIICSPRQERLFVKTLNTSRLMEDLQLGCTRKKKKVEAYLLQLGVSWIYWS